MFNMEPQCGTFHNPLEVKVLLSMLRCLSIDNLEIIEELTS